MSANPWSECCERLQRELENQECKDALDTKDLDAFQAAVDRLCKEYTRKTVTKLVCEKLAPHFDHMKSFEKAIAASAQLHPSTAMLWSGSQAVIEAACRFTDHLDVTLDQLANFYKTLPHFEEHMALFPDNKRLEYPLRDMYNDYATFCITTLQYIKKKPTTNLFKAMMSSKSKSELKNLMNLLQIHKDDFEKAAELAFRQHQMRSPKSNNRQVSASTNPSHIISQRRNLAFLGRDAFLDEIHTDLSVDKPTPDAEPMSCLIRGMGGIGKTQTALEYTYKFKEFYDHVIWLPAETTSELVHVYNQISSRFSSDVGSGTENLDRSQASHNWLETTDKKWLLVFDNVEDWISIKTFWPTTCRAQSAIIVTSQRRLGAWTTIDHELKSLTVDAGAQLLLRYLKRDHTASAEEEELARQIVNMFGCLPLAIAHIAGYISGSTCSLATFRNMATQRHTKIWEGETPDTLYQYDKRLDIVWDFALEELPEETKNLLYTMAFLNPDSIPEELLKSQVKLGSFEEADQDTWRVEFIDLTRQLIKRHLVDHEKSGSVFDDEGWYFKMHRALQRGILYKLDKTPDLRKKVFEKAFSVIREVTPSASPIQVPTPENWPKFEVALPQVMALRAAFLQSREPPMQGTLDFAQLLYDTGFYTWEREMSHQGRGLLRTGEKVLDDLKYDRDSKLRADIHCMRGVIADNIGITVKAEGLEHKKKALTIRQSIVASQAGNVNRNDDILLHNAMNDMAESLLQNYDWQQAKVLVDTCKQKYEDWGPEGKYPFEYGKYYRNTGAVKALRGLYTDAIKYSERAVELAEIDAGITPRYLYYYYDTACHTLQSGETQKALDMHQEIREVREEICGMKHDVTLQSYYTVGAIYDQLGESAKAEKWIRMAVDRSIQADWPEEPLSRARFHLAKVLRKQGVNLGEAAELEKQAREVLQKLLVYDRPPFLYDVDDEMVLFDHLQPAFRGRFTGTALLRLVQQKRNNAVELDANTLAIEELSVKTEEKEASLISSEKLDDDALTMVDSEPTLQPEMSAV